MRRRAWDEEAHAAEIVCSRLGGVAKRVDPGGGAEQLHDFDVALPNGTTVAVEVTRHNRPTSLAVLSELDRREWRFPGLDYDWVVDMVPEYKVASVHGSLEVPLAALEAAAVESLVLRAWLFDDGHFDNTRDDDERSERSKLDSAGAREAAKRLYDIGARLVFRLGEAEDNAGLVIMGEAAQVGATGSSVVVDLVERHAQLADNVAKLCRAGDRAERHLFVWVETSQAAAVAAFAFGSDMPDGGGLPGEAPQLPDCVDAVWAVTAYDVPQIWRYHREEGWRDLGTRQKPE